jgi:hypothetical protein
MRIPFKQYPSPAKANRGRYVMPITLKPLPSPIPTFPRQGEGVLPPYESLLGEGCLAV